MPDISITRTAKPGLVPSLTPPSTAKTSSGLRTEPASPGGAKGNLKDSVFLLKQWQCLLQLEDYDRNLVDQAIEHLHSGQPFDPGAISSAVIAFETIFLNTRTP